MQLNFKTFGVASEVTSHDKINLFRPKSDSTFDRSFAKLLKAFSNSKVTCFSNDPKNVQILRIQGYWQIISSTAAVVNNSFDKNILYEVASS